MTNPQRLKMHISEDIGDVSALLLLPEEAVRRLAKETADFAATL